MSILNGYWPGIDPATVISPVTMLATLLIAVGCYTYLSAPPPRSGVKEPPVPPSAIPVIGHLINLFTQGKSYFMTLDQKYHLSLYAIPLWPFLNARMYLVTSPDWVTAMNKNQKSFAFYKIMVMGLKRVFQIDQRTLETLERSGMAGRRTRGKGDSIFQEMHDMIHATLAPGRHLDDLSRVVLNDLAARVSALGRRTEQTSGGEVIGLWGWVRHHFSLASMTAMYGPHNPLSTNPALIADFWTVDENLSSLMLPWTWITARRIHRARKRLFDGYTEYAAKGYYNEASQLIRSRFAINSEYGIATEMSGRFELSITFALLSNSIPAAFWMLSYILADRELLTALRAEMDQCMRVEETEAGEDGQAEENGGRDARTRTTGTVHINMTKLKTHCPLLASTFREALRLTGSIIIHRWILEDFEVSNPATGEAYVLRKGGLVQFATHVIHTNRSAYGDNVDSFDARRFLPTVVGKYNRQDGEDSPTGRIVDPAAPFRDVEGKVHAGAFRPFSSDYYICPGRHFAQTEMYALVALFIQGFEIEDAESDEGNSTYTPPTFWESGAHTGGLRPAHDVKVRLRRRAGFENVEWRFEM